MHDIMNLHDRRKWSLGLLALSALLWGCGSGRVEGGLGGPSSSVTSELSGNGLAAEYFDNRDFTNLRLRRVDPTVNFNFGTNAPASGMGSDSFSIRWTGFVQPLFSESYTFSTVSDDGIRLSIDGQRIVDNFTNHSPTEDSGTIALRAGTFYKVELEYFDAAGSATAQLLWSSRSQRKEVVRSSQLFPELPLPSPWQSTDVGNVGREGDVQFDGTAFTVSGAGRDIGGTQDSFHFVNQLLEGDGDVIAKVADFGNTGPLAKSGVMIRETNDPSSAHVFMGFNGSGGTSFIRRVRTGGSSLVTAGPAMATPSFVRLLRKGDTFTGFVSADGKAWTQVAQTDVPMAENVVFGLAVTSGDGNGDDLATTTFEAVNAVRSFIFLMRDGVDSEQSAFEYYAQTGTRLDITLDQWIEENLGGRPQYSAFYRNAIDLGFWREMTCTQTLGRGVGGCWVRNWPTPESKDDPNSLDLGTVTMNISKEGYVRFFVFAPGGDSLSPLAILDSEGKKYLPQLCTVCHGGQLNAPGTKPDLGSVFREFEPSLLEPRPGISQSVADREWYNLNKAIRTANVALASEAEGAVKGLDRDRNTILTYIDAMYVQTNPPVALNVEDPVHMPDSWRTPASPAMMQAKATLWAQVVAPYCMGCHRLTEEVNFIEYDKFVGLAAVAPGTSVSLLERYTQDNPDDPKRQVLPFMPQSELMVNLLHSDDDTLPAIRDWLTQAVDPNVSQARVTFTVNSVPASGSDEVRIVGNGNLPTTGVALTRTGSSNSWSGSVALPQGSTVTFRTVVMRGGVAVQQEAEGSHQTTVPAQTQQTVNFTFVR